jgi:DNA-binding protein
MVGIRGVAGAVDVATITRTQGFEEVQLKKIVGEESLF